MRILIAIGCNEYDYANNLTGAEHDAHRIFDALIKTKIGDYDPIASKLLLSPCVEDVRKALREVLFSKAKIDTFAFFLQATEA